MRFETFQPIGFRGAWCLALAPLVLLGCQSARIGTPLTRDLSANDAHTQTEFWSQLSRRPMTSNDEAFHALLLYLDGSDRCSDYPARLDELRRRRLVGPDFDASGNAGIDRGTLAVALVKALKVPGGITMRLFGPVSRYAVRALEHRGIYPPSSPNQGVSGGEFVGIMQKAEEYVRGNPADAPAAFLPREIQRGPGIPALETPSIAAGPLKADSGALTTDLGADLRSVFYLDESSHSDWPRAAGQGDIQLERSLFIADVAPTTAPAAAKHLNVIITGVEGGSAEVRESGREPWVRPHIGKILHEEAEFRTGPKSAIRFIIPPDQTFCVDSQSNIKVMQAVADGKKLKTDIALLHGRVRYDVDKLKPATRPAGILQIEEAGLEHDATIRSPNSALALRGTKVSLFDQPSFTPEAISLTGRAVYVNTLGQAVPFGGRGRTAIRGSQGSAAEQADDNSEPASAAYLARTDFETREIAIVTQRGGFIRGDVIVGDLHLSDFHTLPGALDFVLQWSGGPQQTLNDLNLAVFSPLNTPTSHDFVANPPFTVSLTPNSPASQQIRATSYPAASPSGGRISANSVGPDGLELAYWPKNHPVGNYEVVVFNLVDAKPPPTQTSNPVTYTIDVFLNGQKLTNTYTGSVGLLQTSAPLVVPVPASIGAAAVTAAVHKPASSAARPIARAPVSKLFGGQVGSSRTR